MRRFDARAAVELPQDVPNVPVDGATAEEQLLGNLAIGTSNGDHPHHFELPSREACPLSRRVGRSADPETAGHGLA